MDFGTRYPAALRFDLTPEHRHRAVVLDAAKRLGLKVIPRGAMAFDVVVISPMAAYDFGRACAMADPSDPVPMPPTRQIDLED